MYILSFWPLYILLKGWNSLQNVDSNSDGFINYVMWIERSHNIEVISAGVDKSSSLLDWSGEYFRSIWRWDPDWERKSHDEGRISSHWLVSVWLPPWAHKVLHFLTISAFFVIYFCLQRELYQWQSEFLGPLLRRAPLWNCLEQCAGWWLACGLCRCVWPAYRLELNH